MGCVSEEVKPNRYVLPGCIFPIACTRVYMLRPMGTPVQQHKEVQQTLYVDDFGQYTSEKSLSILRTRGFIST